MSPTARPPMPKAIESLLMTAYYEAKSKAQDEKERLEYAVRHRSGLEHSLALAKHAETTGAVSCQQAADRLEAIMDFLRCYNLVP